jgi:hypothetical protein
VCNNTYGSFSCSCDPGFQLRSDHVSCKAVGKLAFSQYKLYSHSKIIYDCEWMFVIIIKDFYTARFLLVKNICGFYLNSHTPILVHVSSYLSKL